MALAFAVSACGGDDEPVNPDPDPDPDPDPIVTPEPNPETPVMTDAEAKDYLEETALQLINIVNPSDHETLVRVVGYWAEHYEGYDGPENWMLYEDDEPTWNGGYQSSMKHNSMKGFFRAMSRAARGNVTELGRAANEVLNMARFSGIYEPNNNKECWEKIADSNDLVIRFPYNGETVEVRGVASNGTWSESAEGYDAEVPCTVTATLKLGSTELVHAILNNNLNFNTHTVNVELNANMMNVKVSSNTNGTNTTVETETTVWYGSTQIARVVGTVAGSDMVNRDAIEKLFEKYTEDYGHGYVETWYEFNKDQAARMFNTAHTETLLLDRVRVVNDNRNLGDLLNTFEEYFDNYDYPSKDAAEAACRAQCTLLERSVTGSLYLAGSANASATLSYKPVLDDEDWGDGYGYWEWYSEPVFCFSDGTTYSFENYFGGNRFSAIENPLKDMINAYERYWENR